MKDILYCGSVRREGFSIKDHLRMKELTDKTGINKSTILHYIHLGLLPQPVRTAKNMAYYSRSCLHLLSVIRLLQREYHLPLQAIKAILDMLGPEPSIEEALHIYDAFYKPGGWGANDQTIRTYSREEFLQVSGLTGEELSYLQEKRFLIPLEEDAYNADDLVVAQQAQAIKKYGIPLEEMASLPHLVAQLAGEAERFHLRVTEGRNREEEREINNFLMSYFKGYFYYLLRRFMHHIHVEEKGAVLRERHSTGSEWEARDRKDPHKGD